MSSAITSPLSTFCQAATGGGLGRGVGGRGGGGGLSGRGDLGEGGVARGTLDVKLATPQEEVADETRVPVVDE